MNIHNIPAGFGTKDIRAFIAFVNSSEYKDSPDKMKTLIGSPHYNTYKLLNSQGICGKLSERGCFICWTQNRFDPPSTLKNLTEALKRREAADGCADEPEEKEPPLKEELRSLREQVERLQRTVDDLTAIMANADVRYGEDADE